MSDSKVVFVQTDEDRLLLDRKPCQLDESEKRKRRQLQNRIAAQESRGRKRQYANQLENKSCDLETQLQLALQRIEELSNQVVDLQKQLTSTQQQQMKSVNNNNNNVNNTISNAQPPRMKGSYIVPSVNTTSYTHMAALHPLTGHLDNVSQSYSSHPTFKTVDAVPSPPTKQSLNMMMPTLWNLSQQTPSPMISTRYTSRQFLNSNTMTRQPITTATTTIRL